jgi:RhtB (resistance to homoserine/threonine) family protein
VLASILSFAVFAALLTITPGLDTMFVVRTAATSGRRAGFAAALGIGTGCLCWAAAGGLGITALLTASAVAYAVMRVAGAAYLVFLGVRALWRSRTTPATSVEVTVQPASAPVSFRVGLLTNLLNPKIGVFYLAVLPQFLPHGVSPLLAALVLGAVHDVEGLIWFTALIFAVSRARTWLSRASVRRWLDRVTGLVFIGFGLRLALAKARA